MAADDWTGRIVDGRYVVEATLGAGGMGVVLRARHQFTGAAVALKMLRSHLVTNADVQARFLGEARVPSSIGHRGIVQVLDAGRTPEGELYLAMELLDGVSLRDVVRGGLSGAEIKRVVIELLDALAAAHARGVVHRDLKPENVFLTGPTRVVKLLDFGIAKIVQSDASNLGRTSAGDLLGTLAYMAPEQIRDASAVDPRADLWAVGVMVYEMIAGRLPYKPTDLHGLFAAISTRDPDPIGEHVPNVPPAVAAFFARALARDPAQRWATAGELAAAVAALPLEPIQPRFSLQQAAQAHGSAVSGVAPTAASAGGYLTPPAPSAVAPQPYGTNQSQWAHGTNGPQVPPSMVQAPPPPAMTTAHPPRSMWPFALLGIAVIAGIVIIVIVLGGKHDVVVTAPQPGSGSGSSVVVVDPGSGVHVVVGSDDWDVPAKVEPQPDVKKAPPPPPPKKPAAASAVESCVAKCNALGACGLQVSQCIAGCNASGAFAGCLAKLALDGGACNGATACAFALACNGIVPHGSWSCNQTAICQDACHGNVSCGCGCVGNMAPIHALALAALDACATTCGFDDVCIGQNCPLPLQVCGMQ